MSAAEPIDPMLETILGLAATSGWPQEAIDTVRELRRQRDEARAARLDATYDDVAFAEAMAMAESLRDWADLFVDSSDQTTNGAQRARQAAELIEQQARRIDKLVAACNRYEAALRRREGA